MSQHKKEGWRIAPSAIRGRDGFPSMLLRNADGVPERGPRPDHHDGPAQQSPTRSRARGCARPAPEGIAQ